MTLQELKELLDKYKADTISEAERKLLAEQIGNDEFADLIKADILESFYSIVPDAGWNQQDTGSILQEIMATGRLRIARRRIYIGAAAALLAGMIATSVYIGGNKNGTVTKAIAQHKAKAITPGSDKAMLTLGDGSVIPLDSAANGTLANQGGTSITNANGALNYENSGHTTQAQAQVMYNTVTTPHGGQYQLTLADGSKVWLNAASSIRFPTAFTGSERSVDVTGEVYFEVAQNAGQPFNVHVNNNQMTVHVLGTSFNIMAYSDEQAVKTTLVTGSVKLESGANSSLLQPGLQASLNSQNGFKVAPADLDETLAWKDGKFRFRNENIKSIMRQLSRWYDIDVAYAGDVSDIDLTGVISRRENAEYLLNALEKTQRVHFEMNGNKITVSPSSLK
jgi:transmembrane sensor